MESIAASEQTPERGFMSVEGEQVVGERFLVPRQRDLVGGRGAVNGVACLDAPPEVAKVNSRRYRLCLSELNEETRKALDQIRGIGTNLTFEGEYLADFIERLNKVIEVVSVKVDGDTLKIMVGEPRAPSQEEVLRVLAKACLLNVAAAGYEDTEYGKMLYFEYYLPPWNALYVG
jgi:hypothetical protein